MGRFGWGGRRAVEPAEPAPPVEPRTVSKIFPRVLAAIAARPRRVVLDLGPVIGSNVEYLGDRLACKLHIENLVAEVDAHLRRGADAPLGPALAARLTHPDGAFDAVLCWDLFDYLDPAAGRVLAARLARLVAPGGLLHGFFGTTPLDLHTRTRYVIEADDAFRLRAAPGPPVRRQVLLTRDIIRMFDGLEMAESVLLKSGTRETLFRRV